MTAPSAAGPAATGPVATVAVRGSWTAEVPPELARVHVAVGARHTERAQVLRDLAGRLEAVRAALARYGAAVEAVGSEPLWVQPQFRDRKPTERVTGYQAGTRLTVTVVDFTVLGDLVLRLADRDVISTDGPYWALRDDSAAYRRARTEAVRDARRRAEEYAAAVGARLTGLVELADTGLHGLEAAPVVAGTAMFSRAARDSVADEIRLDVEPVRQTVSAAVEARFTATQPDF